MVAEAPAPSRPAEILPKRRRGGETPMRQLLLDFTQPPAPTFANFIHGSNAELFHALEAAARGALAERVMYVWGESGAGKTHLLSAFRDTAGRHPRVLAIDDVERLGEEEQAALFNAFNHRGFDFLLATASSPPAEVPIRRDLATRLATGLTFRLLPLTDEEKGERSPPTPGAAASTFPRRCSRISSPTDAATWARSCRRSTRLTATRSKPGGR
jgi:chromosomal replication initiation ATPase DnaA